MAKMRLSHQNQCHIFLLLLCLNLSHSFHIPTVTAKVARRARKTMPLHPLAYYAQDRHNSLSTRAWSLSKDDDDMERNSNQDMIFADDEQKKLQVEIDNMMNPRQPANPQQQPNNDSNAALFGGGFDAEAFDESKLPLPLFSSVVIFVVSTYLTGYMFYVGIMGFPENEAVPRIF